MFAIKDAAFWLLVIFAAIYILGNIGTGSLTTMEQVKGLEPDLLQQKFIKYADSNSINYIDLLKKLKGRRDLNFVIESHWNKKGMML